MTGNNKSNHTQIVCIVDVQQYFDVWTIIIFFRFGKKLPSNRNRYARTSYTMRSIYIHTTAYDTREMQYVDNTNQKFITIKLKS